VHVRCCVCRARAYEYLLVQPLLTLAGTFLAQSLTRQPGAGGARDGVSRGARGGTGGTGGARRRRRAGAPRPPAAADGDGRTPRICGSKER
jgi:hypothetical protein